MAISRDRFYPRLPLQVSCQPNRLTEGFTDLRLPLRQKSKIFVTSPTGEAWAWQQHFMFFLFWGLPHQCAHWFAMTGFLICC